MLFNSLHFLIFFPIIVSLYYVIPRKGRMCWLLLASYYFYMSWNVKYVILLLVSTVTTYIGGRAVGYFMELDSGESEKSRRIMNGCVFLTVVINLAILFVFRFLK